MTFHPQTILVHGGILALALSAMVLIALRVNPRLFRRSYPAAMREATPPLTGGERNAAAILGLILVSALIVVPTVSAFSIRAGHLGFWSLAIHAFAVGMIFNLADWLIIDELFLGVMRPRWAMLRGAEAVPWTFEHSRHFRGFLTGTVLCAVVGLAGGGLAALFR